MNFEMDQSPGTEYLIFRCAQLGKETFGSWTAWGAPPTTTISVYATKDTVHCAHCKEEKPSEKFSGSNVCLDCKPQDPYTCHRCGEDKYYSDMYRVSLECLQRNICRACVQPKTCCNCKRDRDIINMSKADPDLCIFCENRATSSQEPRAKADEAREREFFEDEDDDEEGEGGELGDPT